MKKDIIGFPTKKALTKAIQTELEPHAIGVEFESPLLSRLIGERHYYCSKHGLVPQRFRKLPSPYSKNGYWFDGWFPEIGWHGVSWTECVAAKWSLDKELVAGLRLAVSPIIDSYRREHPVCERCRVRPSRDVDHVAPEFKEIANAAIITVTESDRKNLMDGYDWVATEIFTLPGDMECVRIVVEAHKTARLMAVCGECHASNARDRKKQ